MDYVYDALNRRIGRKEDSNGDGGVEQTERYVYDDGAGEIGFVSSVSAPFCGDCSRARLSSDGAFYTCLFASQGTDLRSPLRAGPGRPT